MDTQVLLKEITLALPLVPKPAREEIVFHDTGCYQCTYLRDYLDQYSGPTLPNEAIRYLHNEWSCLSAAATRWVLPSYLARCVTQDLYDPIETEFLIYTLGPEPKYEHEATQRFSRLSHDEIGLLLKFLDWCANHPHWSTYCPKNVDQAKTFIHRLWVAAHDLSSE